MKRFPKYYDAYIYRGKLLFKAKRFDKALYNFNAAIEINPSRGLGFIGKADCLRFLNEYEEAIKLYTAAMQKEEVIQKIAILKRAITYLESR